jgi:hypothetical protein
MNYLKRLLNFKGILHESFFFSGSPNVQPYTAPIVSKEQEEIEVAKT